MKHNVVTVTTADGRALPGEVVADDLVIVRGQDLGDDVSVSLKDAIVTPTAVHVADVDGAPIVALELPAGTVNGPKAAPGDQGGVSAKPAQARLATTAGVKPWYCKFFPNAPGCR